jgi:long-chain acyl-CoA synthetase
MVAGTSAKTHEENLKAIVEKSIPKLFEETCRKYWDKKVAIRHKHYGVWQAHTWKDFYENAKYFGLGLKSLGLKNGQHVAIIGDNEPQWLFAQFGTICIKGIVLGLYQDAIAEELVYVINHAEARFIVAEDQEQVDKMLELHESGKIPNVEIVIYWDPKGLRFYRSPFLMSFDDVKRLGQEYEEKYPDVFEATIREIGNDTVLFAYYTSGTTGEPKGLLFDSRILITRAIMWDTVAPATETDQFFSSLPLAYPLDIMFIFLPAIMGGATVNLAEEPETVEQDFREIGPSKALIFPRLLEAQVAKVQVKIMDSTQLQRWAYNKLVAIGSKMSKYQLTGQKPGIWLNMSYRLANWLMFRPLRDQLGYSRIKALVSGGAAISSEVFSFFLGIGIKILNVYGLVEAAPISLHILDDADPETAGVPTHGTQIRISDEGEILSRGDITMRGYYKNPKLTRETLDSRNWFHTGDAGYITENGHLVCIDRVKELMTLSSGMRFSPQYIENKLKFSPYIRDAVIVGDGKPFVAALISIDFPNVSKWAENNHVTFTTFMDLSQKNETYQLIKAEVQRVNNRLPEEQRLKAFLNLYKELDADDAELTRTRKLRRGFVAQRYADFVEALYSEQIECGVKTQVTYRDGRQVEIRMRVRTERIDQDR